MLSKDSVLNSAAFRAIVKQRWAVSLFMTALMLIAYFGFILMVAYNKQTFALLVSNGLTLGLVCGILIIFFAWILTGVYVYWANNIYDSEIAKIKAGLEE